MPQVINEGPSLKANVGSALNGLLESLAATKAHQYGQSQTAKGLQALGYTPEQSTGLSQFDPKLLDTVLKNYQPSAGGGVESIEERKAQHAASKESAAYFKELTQAGKAAKENNGRLDKMIRLIEHGKLPSSGFYNALKSLEDINPTTAVATGAGIGSVLGGGLNPVTGALGGIAGGLLSPIVQLLKSGQRALSPDTEEFEKLSADFIKNAKEVFGSRITDADLRAFMQTVPTLGNTDHGKRKIIENLKEFNNAALIKDKVAREVIKANGGKRPPNLQLIVDEIANPALDKYAEEFKNALKD